MIELMAMGRRWNGEPLFVPRDEDAVVQGLRAVLEHRVAGMKATRSFIDRVSFRGEEATGLVENFANPNQVGWSYIYHAADPLAERYPEIIAPLAEHRGMGKEPALVFHGEAPDEWTTWVTDNYQSRLLDGKRPPKFLLVLGGPDQVPFGFQAMLQTVANVGRLAGTIEEIQRYVDKVLRIERADTPSVDREALFFATDGGPRDPTFYSREYMVDPLAKHVRDNLHYRVHKLAGDEASKANLKAAIADYRPALFYSATHGVGAVDASLEIQELYNGALCCHHVGPQTPDTLFAGNDVPEDGPFLEGAVFFQFACFGYGTPAQSDYLHWLEGFPDSNASRDFLADLPRRLLANPRGPIAYIGHVDTAFLHGFTDAANPDISERWHKRLAPYKAAIDAMLLKIHPSGFAMEAMSNRYSITNAVLTNAYDRVKREQRDMPWDADRSARFLDNWIVRGDAQNFMVMGDPAALLRIPQ